jgi:anti-anti-sigma factor
MSFTVNIEKGTSIITVGLKRATLKETLKFKDVLTEEINKGNHKIIINLSQCEFVDSTFLGIMISTLKKIVKLNGDIRVTGFQSAVRTMFELTGMNKIFKHYESIEEALNSF